MVGVLTWLGTYLALGALSALVWGFVGWRTPDALQTLHRDGYATLRREVRMYQLVFLLGWPFLIPALAVVYSARPLAALGDPHVRHQQSFQRQWREFEKTQALEAELGVADQDKVARVPEPICPCVHVTKDERGEEQNNLDRIIQNYVEAIRRDVGASRGERERRDKRITVNLDFLETYLKMKGVWRDK